MDSNAPLPPRPSERAGRAPGLVARLFARLRQALSAADAHCHSVEEAKEAAERENLKKHGKDWVNRCCG
jgi:hypothetical protein